MDDVSGFPESHVTCDVPELVIDTLEMIKIEHEQRNRCFGALRPSDLILQHGVKGDMVEQAGETITRRQMVHGLLMLFNQLAYFTRQRSEEHTSELQSQSNLVCRLLLEKKRTTT